MSSAELVVGHVSAAATEGFDLLLRLNILA